MEDRNRKSCHYQLPNIKKSYSEMSHPSKWSRETHSVGMDKYRNKIKVSIHTKENINNILDTSQWTEFITVVNNVTDEDFVKVVFLH